jgi:hypothetical protein
MRVFVLESMTQSVVYNPILLCYPFSRLSVCDVRNTVISQILRFLQRLMHQSKCFIIETEKMKLENSGIIIVLVNSKNVKKCYGRHNNTIGLRGVCKVL